MLIVPNGKKDSAIIVCWELSVSHTVPVDKHGDSETKMPWVWILAPLLISRVISVKCRNPVCASVSLFAKWSGWELYQIAR